MDELRTCFAAAEESYVKSATRAVQQWYSRGTAQGAGRLVSGPAAVVIVAGISLRSTGFVVRDQQHRALRVEDDRC